MIEKNVPLSISADPIDLRLLICLLNMDKDEFHHIDKANRHHMNKSICNM